MARFMYGRNGADQLCWALFIAELVLSLLPALVPGQAFAAFIHYTTLFLCVYLLFRMFSRNLEKRRAENAKFMQWWGPKQSAGPPRRQGTQVCEVLLRHLLPCAAQRRNGRIDLSEVRKKADRENLKMSPFEKSAEGRFFCTL